MIPKNTETAPAGIFFPGLEDEDTKMRKNKRSISTKKLTFLVKCTFLKYVQHNTHLIRDLLKLIFPKRAILKFLSIIFSTDVMTFFLVLMSSQLWLPWKISVTLGRQKEWGWPGRPRRMQGWGGRGRASRALPVPTLPIPVGETNKQKEQQKTWDNNEKNQDRNRIGGN